MGNEWGVFRTKHQGTVLRKSFIQEELGQTRTPTNRSLFLTMWAYGSEVDEQKQATGSEEMAENYFASSNPMTVYFITSYFSFLRKGYRS